MKKICAQVCIFNYSSVKLDVQTHKKNFKQKKKIKLPIRLKAFVSRMKQKLSTLS